MRLSAADSRALRVSGAARAARRRIAAVARARRARVARGMGRTFASRVKRIVKRLGETKYVANAPEDGLLFLNNPWQINSKLATVSTYYPAIPSLTQGDDDHERDGAVVQPVSAKVKLNFHFNQDISGGNVQNTNPGEYLIVVYYGTSKKRKSWEGQSPIMSAGELLDVGNGTTTGFGGSQANLLMPINNKVYSAKRRVIKMGKTDGVLSSVAGAGTEAGGYSTSNGQSYRSMTLSFRCPQRLKYDDDASTFPTNYAPWYAIAAIPINKSSTPFDDSNKPPILVTSQCQMWYKDL